MKKFITFLPFLLVTNTNSILADFPIRQSSNWEGASSIAYNSTEHEYLVVWSEYIKVGSFYIIGPIMGQRVNENGNSIGGAFPIFNTGSLPHVAYNPHRNEYLVVAAAFGSIYGQRIDNSGNLIEASIELDWEHVGNWPKVVYNYLSEDYLLVLAALQENPPGSGFYNIKIFGKRVGSVGQPMGLSWLIEDAPYGTNEYGLSRFAIAYAPIQTTETPKGRYLLAVQTNSGINLTMLNQWGYPIDVVYDPQSQQYFRYIPFQGGSVVGGEFNIDVAFGMKAGYNLQGPAFFVVWGDNNNTWDGQEWSGIYGSFVNPYKLDYLTTDPVQDNSFPISAIYDHYAYNTNEYAKSWQPKVASNNAGQKFMVTWRETPTTNSQNDTKVNHIRADKEFTGGSYYMPNAVISAVTGNENPMQPAIASSTINPNSLICWNDYRNFSTTDWDLYGNLYTIPAVPSINVTKPNGGENWFIDTEYEITWTSKDYSSPVRIEYSIDGGASYIEIVNSTANDGSYLWTVPFTLSDFCVVRILDAADSDPFDISDAVFAITTTNKIVTNTNDSGMGSLRQAILDANADSGMDTIIFKIPGTGIHTIQPLSELPAITDPVLIDGFSQPGSSPNTNSISQGCNAYLNIELDGINAGTNSLGLYIKSGSSTIRGLVINHFQNGILIETYGGNIIEGNFIGTNTNGTTKKPNDDGIVIASSDSNLVGGNKPISRNIISGNNLEGIILAFAYEGNLVQGNFIGTDITGLNSLGNRNGIRAVNNGNNNTIGGTFTEERNIISGNNQSGIFIDHAAFNKVEGNFIGTDIFGTNPLPNALHGIHLSSGHTNFIGGTTTGTSNIISGNIGNGIFIEASNLTVIEGNLIGLRFDGISPLGNGKSGVMVNRGDFSSATCLGNRIIGNRINYNDSLGINLDGGNEIVYDVTSNDLSDTDTGPNNLQNYPLLTDVEVDIATFVTGSLNSTANTTFRIDFYSSPVGDPSGFGEGQIHIGWTEVTTDVNGNVDFYTAIGTIVPVGYVITSTATDPNGNTSEFSNWIKTPAPTTYLVNNTSDSGIGSLRQAIIDANNNRGLDSIAFNIPGTGPFTIQPSSELPAITDPVVIDAFSQPGSHPNMYPISEGSNAEIKIELSGINIPFNQYAAGLHVKSGNTTIRGIAINKFFNGITLKGSGGNIIEGNYIGTDITASTSLSNEWGIYIDSSNYNLIGGTTPRARNIISGNVEGIKFWGGMNNLVQGNYIGTDASGLLYLANSFGVVLDYSDACKIGGSADGSENIIACSDQQGLMLFRSSYNYIQKNIIGLDRTGKSKLGNMVGIQVTEGCNSNNFLNNKIGGSGISGIIIGDNAQYNVIADNFIGTDENWLYDLGNQIHGIDIMGAVSNNTAEHNYIENNIIGFNGDCGLHIKAGQHNTATRNLISKNHGKGIENTHGGNKEITPPTILSVNSSQVTGTTGASYRVEIFSDDEDEGRYYLGSTTADSIGSFTFAITEPVPLKHITATCTDLDGNTSEFSAAFVVTWIEDEKEEIPTEYMLYQNYPNPFNPTTTIGFGIPASPNPSKGGALVTLKIYNVLGSEVKILIDEEKEAGYHLVEFDASDLPSGVYFYQLRAGSFVETKKMILLR
jgi:hypothetical protein